MRRKRPHLFGQDPPRNVLPRFAQDTFSPAERAAWRTIRPHLHRFIQKRRGFIGASVSAGAAVAAEFIRSKINGGKPPRGRPISEIIESKSLEEATTSHSATTASLSDMPGDTHMATATHGDACDIADKLFGRDAEDTQQQKEAAASLWARAPRIYDDEIIVRLTFCPPIAASNGANALYYKANSFLATAGTPVVPNIQAVAGCDFILNDIFTPYPTDTAKKPRGYTHYAALYNLYQVLETRWSYNITAINPNSLASDPVKSYPYEVVVREGDNTDPAGFAARDYWELGHSNGADKTVIFHGPHLISNSYSRAPNNVGGSLTFGGTWTPARFDDLQTNITFQPMTAVGAQPNWKNYLHLDWINYNTTANVTDDDFAIHFMVEQLVHFKKINVTKYKVNN